MSNRQSPCANNRVNGCEGVVSQRGTIFCDSCTELRKSISKNRREQDMEELMKKNIEMGEELIRLRQAVHDISQKYEDSLESGIKSRLADSEKDYKQKLAEYQTKFDSIQQINKDLDKANKDLDKANKDLDKANKELGKANKELENAITILRKDKSDSSKYSVYSSQLEKENGRLTDLLSKLRSENENLVKERETYEMTHAQLKIDSETITIENNRIKEYNISLSGQNDDLLKENALLSKLNQDLTEQIRSVQKHPRAVSPDRVSNGVPNGVPNGGLPKTRPSSGKKTSKS